MFGKSKKNIIFITNDKRMLDLGSLGINSSDSIIFNLRKSIYEILESEDDINLIKQSATSGKSVFVIVKENFPPETGSIENLDGYKEKHKKMKKIFKKENNVFFFFGNLSKEEQINDIEDGNITMSDPDFFDNFDAKRKQEILEAKRLEEERIAEEKRIEEERIQEEIRLEEESKLAEERRILALSDGSINGSIDGSSNGISGEFGISNKDYFNEDGLIIQEDFSNEFVVNTFDEEYDEINKKENSIVEYPILDSSEYLLKSIYDFIWRMFILSNNNLLLNDLLYLSINNFPSLSSGQNEFIRELSNDVDSLFDLILKLDHELEFNNKLFYIYLANFFTVINGLCKVNREFLSDISIWITAEEKENFIIRVENFMNNNLISIQKVIYSHFIEFATIGQSAIPRIRGSLKYEDIHIVLFKKLQYSRRRNLFVITLKNLYRAADEMGLDLESIILNKDAIDSLDSELKKDIANSYNMLLEEVRNCIFLKGSNELNISRMYNILMNITITSIFEERVVVMTISDLVNKDQIQIEDEYYNYINNKEPRNEIINIKYEEIEALYREAISSEKNKNINNDIYEFNLDGIKNDFLNKYKNQDFDKEYGMRKELDLESMHITEDGDDMSKKIDDYESKIRANIKRMEEQREVMKKRMEVYSDKSSGERIIKMK